MKLTEKLCAIMGELKPIVKEKKPGAGVSYAFRGIDDVVNALNPLLVKHGVFVTCEILRQSFEVFTTTKSGANGSYEQRGFYAHVTARYWFHSGDEKIFTDMVAGSMDYSDKAETQAMSMALKYAYIQCFNITTADLKDPDANAHEVFVPTTKPTTKPTTVSDEKFSWDLLKNGKWDGKFDGDVITILSKKGIPLKLQLTEMQKQAAENYKISKK
jgi:hypothetical protein